MAGPILAVDPGTRRVGIAVSDPEARMALPLGVLAKDESLARIERIVDERGISEVIVGLPLTMAGHEGPAAESARVYAADLRNRLEVPVRLVDERLTTVIAERRLQEAGLPVRRARRVVDAGAASELLQSYLERGSAR